MTIENKLKDIIKEKYGSVSEFARQIDLNESTVRTVLSVSGIHKTSVNVLFKITKALYIDAESLYFGEIKYLDELKNDIVYKSSSFINELRGGEYRRPDRRQNKKSRHGRFARSCIGSYRKNCNLRRCN